MKFTLKACRVNKDLTQQQVADILGVSKYTVCNWESGRTKVRKIWLKLLADLYEVNIEDIKL